MLWWREILCCGGGRFYVVEEGEVNTLITRFDIQRKSHEEINAAKFAKFYFLSIINFIPPRENAWKQANILIRKMFQLIPAKMIIHACAKESCMKNCVLLKRTGTSQEWILSSPTLLHPRFFQSTWELRFSLRFTIWLCWKNKWNFQNLKNWLRV